MSNQHDNVDAGEIAKFSQIADKWWDKNGEFKPCMTSTPCASTISTAMPDWQANACWM